MLMQIRCDKFAKDFKTINFHKGLNIIFGSSGNSSASGKSTFLRIIDFAFGEDLYLTLGEDIKNKIGNHLIFFTFLFDDQYFYFSRELFHPNIVRRHDKYGMIADEMSLEDYRIFLREQYGLPVSMNDFIRHFFRIYGRENVFEGRFAFSDSKETGKDARNFLLRLFGNGNLLEDIEEFESKTAVKNKKITPVFLEKLSKKIETNKEEIEKLKKNLSELTSKNGDIGIEFLGFDSKTLEDVLALKREITILVRNSALLKSKLESVKNGNIDFLSEKAEKDFNELKNFFPSVNLKKFEEIADFHVQIRKILREESREETERLLRIIANYEDKISSLKKEIESKGINDALSKKIFSKVVDFSKQIECLESDNQSLESHLEQCREYLSEKEEFDTLINKKEACSNRMVDKINNEIHSLNLAVSGDQSLSPKLKISKNDDFNLSNPNDTSEGTAYKNVVLYDLSLLRLTKIPALIHDSNILKPVDNEEFVKIINAYQGSEKQIFIVADRSNLEIPEKFSVIKLSSEQPLFGFSWSNKLQD